MLANRVIPKLCYALALTFVAMALQIQHASAANNEAVGAAMRAMIEGGQSTIGTDDEDGRLIDVFIYYENRSFKPIWVRDTGPKTKGKKLLEFIGRAPEHGLVSSDYWQDEINSRIGASDPKVLAELDLLMSRAFIDLAQDLNAGRVEPSSFNRELHIYPQSLGAATLLNGAEAADDIIPYMESLAPQSARYARLRAKLAEYRGVAAAGGWTNVPEGEVLKPGMDDPRVAILRTRLMEMGDLPEGAHEGTVYEGHIIKAVQWFQYRHGLAKDGVVGPATLAAINTPVGDRIVSLELNMERRRWLPADFGEFYVFVNLADQFLKVVQNGKTIHTALVVVGKPFFRTPVFTKEMKYIVFNPYWNVPRSIAVNELLPDLIDNPGALQHQNIRVLSGGGEVNPYTVNWSSYGRNNFPFRLRQDPGPSNALGRVKFMFPNEFNIYIHDTPAKSLFSRPTRAFSHGCIRVQNPDQLAEVLLSGQGWDRSRIDASFAQVEKLVVGLQEPIPVHITYLTSFVNKDMSAHFRADVYGRDVPLSEALAASRRVLN